MGAVVVDRLAAAMSAAETTLRLAVIQAVSDVVLEPPMVAAPGVGIGAVCRRAGRAGAPGTLGELPNAFTRPCLCNRKDRSVRWSKR